MATVLVAEDQVHIRHVLAMWLQRHGHRVIEACNGRIALDALASNHVDLLISDVNMPEMDGIELSKRAFDACPALRKILIVTSRCDQQEIVHQLDPLRTQMFPKPFSPSQLLKVVDAALAATPAPVQEGVA